MGDTPDIAAYLERVGHAGSLAPTAETLAALVRGQLAAIPLDTLDGLMGVPPRAGLANLQQKLVFEKRGGTGTELNLLLGALLAELDHQVTGHWADTLSHDAGEAVPPGRHLVLVVQVGGAASLVDAGFGSQTPPVPLRLRAGLEQETPGGTYRLTGGEPVFTLELRDRGEYRPLYRFNPSEIAGEPSAEDLAQPPVLTVARTEPDGTRTWLLGRVLSTRSPDGVVAREDVAGVAALKTVLQSRFGLGLPPAEKIDAVLEPLFGS